MPLIPNSNDPESTMPLLEIEKLSVTFQTAGGLLKAVDRISLNVEPGEVLKVETPGGGGFGHSDQANFQGKR